MLIKRAPHIPPSEITSESIYERRREFMRLVAAGAIAGGAGFASSKARAAEGETAKLGFPITKSAYSLSEKPNDWGALTQYNNYYEFGTGKSDPARNAHRLQTRPWTVVIEGEVKKPRSIGIEELLKLGLEERIYRLRCVEAWSMVVPWVGFEFNKIAKLVEPTGNAKFVEFVTAVQPENMPGTKLPYLDWPYVEGLRIDEAMHPLTIMAVGLYDRILPNQNGAPMRLVVPWKYGFKSGKSITRIRFVEKQPQTAWEKANRSEYGFYSNVNPDVDHPRWSQKTEKQLPALFSRRKTEMFNGYAEQVGQLYAGMDLRKYF
ncbi:MAG TPA: protein-methionine-sulfoxide reductase catalytic subunit MsrP [Burkholderiales bacterium]|nr:protein-methionine-sulfoxide reductase catalytic subunit MsrP [Burkholderiales bacterium]